MSRGSLNSIAKSVTRDIFKIILRADKPRTRRKLPGRASFYSWDESFKRDPDSDTDAVGFIVKLEVINRDEERPSIDGEAGELDGDPVIWIKVYHDHRNVRHRHEIYQELVGVVRHELEHLTSIGPLTMPGPNQKKLYGLDLPTSGKALHDINRRRKLFGHDAFSHISWAAVEHDITNSSKLGCFKSYVTSYDELGPFVTGFVMQSKASRLPFEQVVNDYLDYFVEQKRITGDDKDYIVRWLLVWASDRYPRALLRGKHPNN